MADDAPDPRLEMLQAAYAPARDEPTGYTTADLMAHYQAPPEPSWHDKYVKPWGSAYPREPWAWTKDYPNLANFLARVPDALMAMPGRAPRGATPTASPLWSMSPNRLADFREVPGAFSHILYHEGVPVAKATGAISGNTATLGMIKASEGRNTLGIEALRQWRELMRKQYPEVTNFEGRRMSGTRKDKFQDVEMP